MGDGCKVKLALFESFTQYENEPAYNNDISVSVQVAFILAGSTHTTYCKTLQNALGMKTVNARVFLNPVVKSMVDDLCEVAKREMIEKNVTLHGKRDHLTQNNFSRKRGKRRFGRPS